MAKQTTFRTSKSIDSGIISLPYGIIELVRAGFRRLGLYEYLDGFKERGVPLSYVVELMCIHQLDGGSSMSRCSELTSSDLVAEELCHGYRISQRTLNRGLEFLDQYFEETIDFIWRKLQTIYPLENTDVYVDGSHIERYGCRGSYTAAGEGGGSVQLQDQFVVAQLKESGLPILIEAYPGNFNDPMQYDDFIPQLLFMLKKHSMIIIDNGGSNHELLNDITDNGMDYLTRVKMNLSDDERIAQDIGKMEYLGRGMGCIRHCFDSSQKTTYLYFSTDRYILGTLSADRRAAKMAEELQEAREMSKDPKLNKLVSMKRNPFYEVKITSYEIRMTLDPWLDEDVLLAAKQESGERCGWFKLQCSRRLSSKEALETYRHRVGIEHLISSIKSVVNIKPLRVWSEKSVRGSLLLALIAQLQVSMVRYDLEPDLLKKMIDGRLTEVRHKPSEKTIIENLGHLTVTVIPREGWTTERIISNKTELNQRILDIIKQY